MASDSAAVLEAVACQDTFNTWYRNHHGWLRGWLQRKLKSSDDAADLAQDTFIRLLAGRDLQLVRTPRAYLTTVARALLANHFRRRDIEQAYARELAASPDLAAASAETRAIILEALHEIATLLDGLPRKVRTAFLLSQLECLPQAEIATRLGVSVSSVKKYILKALSHCMAHGTNEQLERTFSVVPAQLGHAVLDPSSNGRRRAIKQFALLFSAGPALWLAHRSGLPAYVTSDYRTSIGERRQVRLDDGTQLDLNTASLLSVEYDPSVRLLRLHRGEILVTTSADSSAPSRPFIVATPHGIVRALGTHFLVRTDDDGSHVSVYTHAVEIQPEAVGHPLLLQAGQACSFNARNVTTQTPADENEAAWSRGFLLADDWRLERFITTLARYRPGWLQCDPSVQDLRISGSFPLDDTDRVLDSLTETLPVAIHRRSNLWVTVTAHK